MSEPRPAAAWVEPAQPVVSGELVDRPNRFLAHVRLPGGVVAAHVPNPGRMVELMVAGRRVHLAPAGRPGRVTSHDLLAVEHQGCWVCIDNRLGGRLARRALEQRVVPELLPYDQVQPEVKVGTSRIDFLLSGGDAPACWVEVKSCTLVTDGDGRFPDAPTARGRRHLLELTERVSAGQRAAVLFIVQRPDAVSLGPNWPTDPAFGEALTAAAAAGVLLTARVSTWTADGLRLGSRIPVRLD